MSASVSVSATRFQFKALRLFMWNEKLSKNNVPPDEGVFLFTVHYNKDSSKRMNAVTFDIHDLIYRWPLSCYSTVLRAVQDIRYLESSSGIESLSNEIAEYMSICFSLTMGTLFFPACPSTCLVFSVELLEVECVDGRPHQGSDHRSLISASPSLSLMDVRTCISRDEIVMALISMKPDDVSYSLDAPDVVDGSGIFDDEDPIYLDDMDHLSEFDDEESNVGSAMDDDSVEEEEEEEEFAEVARVLRAWRGIDRTTPVLPRDEYYPVGLILFEPKLEIVLEAAMLTSGGSLMEDIDRCPICLDKFDDDKKMATKAIMRTKCGHVFHRRCIYDWLRNPERRSCPMCRSCCVAGV